MDVWLVILAIVVGAVALVLILDRVSERPLAPPPDDQNQPPLDLVLRDHPLTVSRTYHGKAVDAQRLRIDEAVRFDRAGYDAVSEVFTPTDRSSGLWIVAIPLVFVIGIGVFVIIYLMATKPSGDLVVIYVRRQDGSSRRRRLSPTHIGAKEGEEAARRPFAAPADLEPPTPGAPNRIAPNSDRSVGLAVRGFIA